MNYLNIAAYKFINLATDCLTELQKQLKQQAQVFQIKGTILLSQEGINLCLAARPDAMQQFIDFLCNFPQFTDLQFKRSQSGSIPFKRLLVRIKKEIITMKVPHIQPQKQTAPYIEPAQLKEWYDSRKPMVLLDTRNTFEVSMGTFSNAVHLNIENFSEFPKAITNLPDAMKSMPVVTFCTGGIRCEKAAAYLQTQGFTNVLQLRGGILSYFENCGGEYFAGKCFVFDGRVALNAQLQAESALEPEIS